jgi:hypothetical protein
VAGDSIPHVDEVTCGQNLEALRQQAERIKRAHEETCERITELEKSETAQKD